jgi:cell division protein FtsB
VTAGGSAAARVAAPVRRRVSARAVVLLVTVGALLVAAVYPVRALLREKAQVSSLQQDVTLLQHANAKLDARIRLLHDPAYLERLARECLGMIKPGEVPFVVVPKHGKGGSSPC